MQFDRRIFLFKNEKQYEAESDINWWSLFIAMDTTDLSSGPKSTVHSPINAFIVNEFSCDMSLSVRCLAMMILTLVFASIHVIQCNDTL